MTHGSLFSGIGGFDLAAEWMGWENVFHCEWNTFGQKVLHHYWPNAIQYHDITKTDFTVHRGTIEILTGGFPCQPYSMAGKRKGKDDERHLWPEMCRAIREIQPRWIVGENVLGLVNWNGGLVFEEVQADLEAEGYEVQPYILPAAAVNAPHRRDRVWFVAYAGCDGFGKRTGKGFCKEWKEPIYENYNNMGNQGKSKTTPTPNSDGLNGSDCEHEINPSQGGFNAQRDAIPCDDYGNAADTDLSRCRQSNEKNEGKSSKQFDGNSFSQSNAFDTSSIGRNTVGNEGGNIDTIEGKREFSRTDSTQDWWRNFPSQSPVCSGNDGIPTGLDGVTFSKWRNESIKGYGNAVVPQVVYQIFKAIAEYDRTNHPDADNGAPPAGGVVRE